MTAPVSALYYPNRVTVVCTPIGTSNVTIASTSSQIGFKTLSTLTDLTQVDYIIEETNGLGGALTGNWEVGTGRRNGATFERTTVSENQSGGTSPVNFTNYVKITVGSSSNLFQRIDYVTNKTAKFNYFGGVVPTVGQSRFYPEQDSVLAYAYVSLSNPAAQTSTFDILVSGTVVGTVTVNSGAYRSSNVTLSSTLTTSQYITINSNNYLTGNTVVGVIYRHT